MKAVCTNPNCRALFTPRNALQLYCSRKCSAHVRNRRYYCTANGRDHKRVAASRYFQAHTNELYDRKAARFQRYYQEETEQQEREIQEWEKIAAEHPECKFGDPMLPSIGAAVREQHDWHPSSNPTDGCMGRWLWLPEDGELVQRLVRGNDTDYRCGFKVNEIGGLVAVSPDPRVRRTA